MNTVKSVFLVTLRTVPSNYPYKKKRYGTLAQNMYRPNKTRPSGLIRTDPDWSGFESGYDTESDSCFAHRSRGDDPWDSAPNYPSLLRNRTSQSSRPCYRRIVRWNWESIMSGLVKTDAFIKYTIEPTRYFRDSALFKQRKHSKYSNQFSKQGVCVCLFVCFLLLLFLWYIRVNTNEMLVVFLNGQKWKHRWK